MLSNISDIQRMNCTPQIARVLASVLARTCWQGLGSSYIHTATVTVKGTCSRERTLFVNGNTSGLSRG